MTWGLDTSLLSQRFNYPWAQYDKGENGAGMTGEKKGEISPASLRYIRGLRPLSTTLRCRIATPALAMTDYKSGWGRHGKKIISPDFFVENFPEPGAFFRFDFFLADFFNKDFYVFPAEPAVSLRVDAVRLENSLLFPAPDRINMYAQEFSDIPGSKQCLIVSCIFQCDKILPFLTIRIKITIVLVEIMPQFNLLTLSATGDKMESMPISSILTKLHTTTYH